jgi:hypothetical protein
MESRKMLPVTVGLQAPVEQYLDFYIIRIRKGIYLGFRTYRYTPVVKKIIVVFLLWSLNAVQNRTDASIDSGYYTICKRECGKLYGKHKLRGRDIYLMQ